MSTTSLKKRGRPSNRDLCGRVASKYNFSNILDFATVIRSEYPIDMIEPNSYNVNSMTPEEFKSLKESIKTTKGELLRNNPLKLYHDKLNEKYVIIDGEHRWRACKELGFKTIPAEIEVVNLEDAKRLNVVLSKNRGKIDYFKLSKLLNEEYFNENGKKRYTQKQLAEKFGYSVARIKHIIHIYPNLKNILESAQAHFFSNKHLEELSRCRNEILRKKLFEQTKKESLDSREIRKQATKFNKISHFLKNEFSPEDQEGILSIYIGDAIFNLSYDKLIEAFFHQFVENKQSKIYSKYLRLFNTHSQNAINYRNDYLKKNNGLWEGWYKEYITSDKFQSASQVIWEFYREYFHGKVICSKCKKQIKTFNQFTPHHKDYEFKSGMLWYPLIDNTQKIEPVHTKCHVKGGNN